MTSNHSTETESVYLTEWARDMHDLFKVYGRPIESMDDPRAAELVGCRRAYDDLQAVRWFFEEGHADEMGEDYFNLVFAEKPPVPLAVPGWAQEWSKVSVSQILDDELSLEMWADQRFEDGMMHGEISQSAIVRLRDGRVRFSEPTFYLGRGKTEIDLSEMEAGPFVSMLSRLIEIKNASMSEQPSIGGVL